MKILLVYPKFQETFWGWKHALKLIGKRAAFPPLGLITVAAMLPKSWDKRLIDLNVSRLTDSDIGWADYVFVSAMTMQEGSTREVLLRCFQKDVPVVLGGPILEKGCDEFPTVEHFLAGEVEQTISDFLSDFAAGELKKIYRPASFPEMAISPTPLWELINPKYYASMLVQYGRGCPFKCEFCTVADINGRVPRAKSPKQFLRELDALHNTGFKGGVMVADDNFIGNKTRVKAMLRELIGWQNGHKRPFEFTVEADITLSDDEDLMDLMVLAGVKKVFLGLETPNKESLIECGKTQNATRDLVACVKKIQNHGLIPMSGFILGFDHDGPGIFKQHVDFYRATGIVFPMIGVLQSPKGSLLYDRMRKEGRLQTQASGNNTDCYPNFTPKMPVEALVRGYKEVWEKVYSPKEYYERIRAFLREYNTDKKVSRNLTATDIYAFFMSVWRIGLFGGFKTSFYYWLSLAAPFLEGKRALAEAVTFQIYGFHFHKYAESVKKS